MPAPVFDSRRRRPGARLPAIVKPASILPCAAWLAVAAVAPAPGAAAPPELHVSSLRCEGREQPLGIDHPAPRLSWTLESPARGQAQTAYRIVVAPTPEDLAAGRNLLWDTGKTRSAGSIQVPYAGTPPACGQRCFWKVMAWDRNDAPSAWSAPAWWEMGLLGEADWRARWIGDGRPLPQAEAGFYQDDPAPLFRREFTVAGPVRRARLYFCGLGYGQPSLNGAVVGDAHLDPLWTRPDKRVFYSVHDVTGQLAEGRNCLGVTLGNGWFNPLPLRMWGRYNLRDALPVGRPRFIARLEIEHADGSRSSVASDTSWKWAPGPILRNSIYLGETCDATRAIEGWDRPGLDDAGWQPAHAADAPGGTLQARPLPPIRATATLRPVRVTQPAPGVCIVDMGRNFSGWARFTFDASRGTRIVMRYGELLHPDGTLNPMTSVCGQIKGTPTPPDHPGPPGVAWQADTYVARGGGPETYTPRFTFHAFRYVEVTGLPRPLAPDHVEGIRLNCDVEPVGSFECSNELFNRIQEMCRWTFLSNLFGVQSDCPHRERFGYGGDLAATSDAFMLNFDMAGFYAKAARDWHDSALPDGMLTDTAPFVGIQYCGLGWAMAHPLLQLQLHRYYGDRRTAEEQYPVSRRWFELVRTRTPDCILKEGLHDHECLEAEQPPPMVTPLYCETARMLARLAGILGRGDEAADYRQLAGQIRSAWLQQFLAPGTGKAASGTQGAQAFALALDMLPPAGRPAALDLLEGDIAARHGHHLTTGIFGTRFVLETLSREGRVETVNRVVNQRAFPGWGHMLDQGATTLWEHWQFSDNTYSHNHPMFGSVSQWFYNWLGGIEPAADAAGFDRIHLQPRFVEGLEWVNCSVRTVRGPVTCNWRRTAARVAIDISVPVGATAEFTLPAATARTVTEGGRPAAEAAGVQPLPDAGGLVRFQLAAGSYRFEAAP